MAIALSAMLTSITRKLALHFNFVAKPSEDRWHKKPTALMGGVAIYGAFIIAYFALTRFHGQTLSLVLLASSLFFLGLYDDFFTLKPHIKLIAQIFVAALLIKFGFLLPLTQITALNQVITIFWIVGITNAFNLLDNMDGLSAGIGTIACIFSFLLVVLIDPELILKPTSLVGQQLHLQSLSQTSIILAGALIGFLFYNFNPASIFMGDAGSLFLGFLVSGLTIADVGRKVPVHLFFVLLIPALILIIPIFDTSLVTIMRKFNGKAISQGGRDHSSHRLVTMGFSERKAVIVLYTLAFASGCVALVVRKLSAYYGYFIVPLFILIMALLGIYLARVNAYPSEKLKEGKAKGSFTLLLGNLTYKRRIFEVFLDLGLIVLAYYGAYILRYEGEALTTSLNIFLKVLPIIIACKISAFLAMGVYRGSWRYLGVGDMRTFIKAVTLGSMLSIFVCYLIYRLEGFGRSIFVIDWLLLFSLMIGTRFSYRFFLYFTKYHSAEGDPVVIYGAGDGGELALRELLNNRELGLYPIGFVDDDPMKKGLKIHGYTVLGNVNALKEIVHKQKVDKVLVACRMLSDKNRRRLLELCRENDLEINRIRIEFSRIAMGHDQEKDDG